MQTWLVGVTQDNLISPKYLTKIIYFCPHTEVCPHQLQGLSLAGKQNQI